MYKNLLQPSGPDDFLPLNPLPGRAQEIATAERHFVLDTPIKPPFPAGYKAIQLGMGCFWGAERMFWGHEGVYSTAVGYAGGVTPNPTYEEVCSGGTGHAEVVLVIYDPNALDLEALLVLFFEGHDPTQGMRQGNDRGTQYRSALYLSEPSETERAMAVAERYAQRLSAEAMGPVTTEFRDDVRFYYAETYHQQYLAKNPNGYCGLGGTGVAFHA